MLEVSLLLWTLLAIFIGLYLYYRKRKLTVLRRNGIDGPPPNLFDGNLYQWKFKHPTRALDLYKEWHKKYGNVYGFYFGLQPRVVVQDLDILRRILVSDIENFTNRPDNVARDGVKNLVTANGQRWKDMRHILTPGFTLKKLKSMLPIMKECSDTLVEVLSEKAEKGEPFDVKKTMEFLTMDVILKCAFAVDLDSLRNNDNPLSKRLRALFQLNLDFRLLLVRVFPELTQFWIKVFRRFSTRAAVNVYLADILKKVISERRNKKGEVFHDILQLMLDASESKNINSKTDDEDQHDDMFDELEAFDKTQPKQNGNTPKRQPLNDQELIGNSIIYLIAGFETTSNNLTFILYCLTRYPEIQEKLREQIMEATGGKSDFSYDDVLTLPYLDQVVNEALRMYPPITSFVTRECANDYSVGNITFPKGCTVEVPVMELHYDPDHWEEPEVFNPDRFSPENKQRIKPISFIPFGYGPRMCIGARFAQIEVKHTLAKLLMNFRFVRSETFEDDLKVYEQKVILCPVNGIWIKPVKIDR